MGCRKDCNVSQLQLRLPRQSVNLCNPIHFIPEKFHPVGFTSRICRKNLHYISPHPKGSPVKIHIIAGILNIDQLVNHLIPVFYHAGPKRNHHLLIINRRAQPINTGHRGHNNHISAFRKCRRSRMAQLINLIIDCRVLLYICVGRGNIGLRLVVVVVRDKILDCILREELLKLAVKLGCQSFIVCDNQGRLIQSLNDISHGKGLSGTRNP